MTEIMEHEVRCPYCNRRLIIEDEKYCHFCEQDVSKTIHEEDMTLKKKKKN